MDAYENAPATKMIAVFCACCAKALVDAVSVETGVGPECRKKHGFANAAGPADWDAAFRALEGVLDTLPEGWEADAHKVSNVLVHRIACDQTGPFVVARTNALRALGYTTLAARIAKRLSTISIVEDGDVLKVKTPFEVSAVEIMRRAPGRYVGKGVREVPNNDAAKRALFGVLRQAYPKAVVDGPKGVFQIAA